MTPSNSKDTTVLFFLKNELGKIKVCSDQSTPNSFNKFNSSVIITHIQKEVYDCMFLKDFIDAILK